MGTRLRAGAPTTALATALVIAVGCAPDAPSAHGAATVRDSAGIEIVEFPESQYAAATAVPIATAADVSVGAVAGAPEQMLYRVGTVRWIDESRLVVANAGTAVRIYDRNGGFLRSFGRAGEGPGEFTRIVGALPTDEGDVLVIDGSRRHFALFDTAGTLIRAGQFEDGVPGSPDLVRAMTLVGKVGQQVPVNGPKIERRTDTIVTVSAETGARLAASPIRGGTLWWTFHQEAGMPMALGRTLSPSAWVSARAGQVVAGASDRYELRVFDEALELRRIIRVAKPATPVGAELREYYSRTFEEDGRPDYMMPPLMDSVPHFVDIEVDLMGRIWVRLEHGGDTPDLEWDVFSPDGRSLQRVQLPDGLGFRDANGASWVGVRTDELDVEYLHIGTFSDSLWNAP